MPESKTTDPDPVETLESHIRWLLNNFPGEPLAETHAEDMIRTLRKAGFKIMKEVTHAE